MYGKLLHLIAVEAKPQPLHLMMVRRVKVHTIRVGSSHFTFPRLDTPEGCIATVNNALTDVKSPVSLACNGVRPVKAMSLAIDSMVIIDV